jgi:hypothetical protein
MMAVMLKVNNLNCIALKLKELSFYMAFTVRFYRVLPNLLKLKFAQGLYVHPVFKNSVRTSKGTPHFTITTINWLTPFKEMIAVYSDNIRNT